jgi:hypothetical protein
MAIATETIDAAQAPAIRQLLAALRWRLRAYLWLRGAASVAALVAVVGWTLIAIDWAFEPDRELRLTLLAAGGLAIAYGAWRFLFADVFMPLSDRSLAVILEREHGALFRESLLTAVELGGQQDKLSPDAREMLAHSCRLAADRAVCIDVNRLFNLAPLAGRVALAAVLVAPAVVWAAASPGSLSFALARLSTWSDAPWPRRTRLVVEGFRNGVAVVPRGGDLNLVVNAATDKVVPDTIEVRYRTEDGARERKIMVREGQAQPGRDRFQKFVHTFQGVLAPLEFEVRGGDVRIRHLKLRVVDSPAVTLTLYCRFPEYTRLAPRELAGTATLALPRGTQIEVRAEANKDLTDVHVESATLDQPVVAQDLQLSPGGPGHRRRFKYLVDRLEADTTLTFLLLDVDGVRNREPQRLLLAALADVPPEVSVRPTGVGAAITPQARIPLRGSVKDDYGVKKTWLETTVDKEAVRAQPLAAQPGDVTPWPIDEAVEVQPWKLKAGQKLLLLVAASDDRHDGPAEQPLVGRSERFSLDVVSPEELRAMLEARELNLRQRFESVITEATETRDSLAGLDLPESKSQAGAEPGDKPQLEQPDPGASADERRRLLVERASQNSQKNAEEVGGLADSFDLIREELVNNRVDTEELRVRLKERIAEPLRAVAGQMLPELRRRLDALAQVEPAAGAAQDAVRTEARQQALGQADRVVVEMLKIRDRMLELETFNEAIELLRSIIAAQHNINEQTKKARAEALKKLLED